jgi:dihydrofolate reductase
VELRTPRARTPGGVWNEHSGNRRHQRGIRSTGKSIKIAGDIGEAVATARSAAGGKNLEILGADVAGPCLRRGLVDEILVYLLPLAHRPEHRFPSRAHTADLA